MKVGTSESTHGEDTPRFPLLGSEESQEVNVNASLAYHTCSMRLKSSDRNSHFIRSRFLYLQARRHISVTAHQLAPDVAESIGRAVSWRAVQKRVHAGQLYAR